MQLLAGRLEGGKAGGDRNHCYVGIDGHDGCVEGEGGGQANNVELGKAVGRYGRGHCQGLYGES